jgi:N-sulfoglucosamine sulfohydrolase
VTLDTLARGFGAAFALTLGALSQQPAAESGAPRPNILFAIADDWSAGHASCLGTAWVSTPSFDRIAAEGFLLTQAYTPNAKCAPSRAAILTGRNSWQLEAAANHIAFFPPRFGGFVEALAAGGYETAFTGKGWGPGIARHEDGSPRPLTGKRFSALEAEPPTTGISKNSYADNFEAFLDQRDADRPFVFWYGSLEPHRGYEPGSGIAAGKDPADIGRVPSCWPDTPEVRSDMLDYAVEVEHFDRHLGRMLETLDARGLAASTIVIVTSDHGMPFPRAKGQAYPISNEVPLAIRWPDRLGAGVVVDDFVSLIDLAPTILDAAGAEPNGMAAITGRSLLPRLLGSSRTPHRDHILLGKERHDVGRPLDGGYPIRGIRRGPWLYLVNHEPSRWPAGNPETGYLNCDASPTKSMILARRRSEGSDPFWDLCFGPRTADELYHLGADPDAVVNLAGRAAFEATRSTLRAELEAALTVEGDPRASGEGSIFDSYPVANRGQQGFYERFQAGERPPTGWVLRSDYEPEPLPFGPGRR